MRELDFALPVRCRAKRKKARAICPGLAVLRQRCGSLPDPETADAGADPSDTAHRGAGYPRAQRAVAAKRAECVLRDALGVRPAERAHAGRLAGLDDRDDAVLAALG